MHSLFMGPYHYDGLKKATLSNIWRVRRQNASQAPNWFVTTNGNNFTPVTDVQPQEKYNWLTAELVRWNTFDGRPGLGILYKPDNFDGTKKYPVILQYYEQKSDQLREFHSPAWSVDEMNIPYYVSQGYLVFVPDI